MKRTILAIYLGGFLLQAETPAPNEQTKLQPYQTTALANALRGLNGRGDHALPDYLQLRNFKANPRSYLTARAKTPSISMDCVIPLLEAHANRALDKEMRVPVKRDSSVSDRMPTLKGLPACHNNKE